MEITKFPEMNSEVRYPLAICASLPIEAASNSIVAHTKSTSIIVQHERELKAQENVKVEKNSWDEEGTLNATKRSWMGLIKELWVCLNSMWEGLLTLLKTKRHYLRPRKKAMSESKTCLYLASDSLSTSELKTGCTSESKPESKSALESSSKSIPSPTSISISSRASAPTSTPTSKANEYPATLSFRRAVTAPCIRSLSRELEENFRSLEEVSPAESERKPHVVHLPQTEKKTLVLDLDETLIYAIHGGVHDLTADVNLADLNTIKVRDEDGETHEVQFLIRPDARAFIKEMAQFYDLVVFTAAIPAYARKVVSILDPDHKYISAVLSREDCWRRGVQYRKDLGVLGGRDKKDIIMVDNNVVSFADSLENGIYVPSFHGDSHDVGLVRIISFLKHASTLPDVRPAVRSFAGISALYDEYRNARAKST